MELLTRVHVGKLFKDMPTLRTAWLRNLATASDDEIAAVDFYDSAVIGRLRATWLKDRLAEGDTTITNAINELIKYAIMDSCTYVMEREIVPEEQELEQAASSVTEMPSADVEPESMELGHDEDPSHDPPSTSDQNKTDLADPTREEAPGKRTRRRKHNNKNKAQPSSTDTSFYNTKKPKVDARELIEERRKAFNTKKLERPKPLPSPPSEDRSTKPRYGAIMDSVKGMATVDDITGFVVGQDSRTYFPKYFSKKTQRVPYLHEPDECKLCAYISHRVPPYLCLNKDQMVVTMVTHARISYNVPTEEALRILEYETPALPDDSRPVEDWFIRREDM